MVEMERARRLRLALVVVVLGLTPALALASSPKPVTASSGPLKVTLVPPPTHTPTATAKVPISVSATLSGKPVKGATAKYEFLFEGAVVQTEYPRYNKHFTFNGHFSDTLGPFGTEAEGEPLTVRFVIADAGHTVNFNWAIDVAK
jgi:hypothetical protein